MALQPKIWKPIPLEMVFVPVNGKRIESRPNPSSKPPPSFGNSLADTKCREQGAASAMETLEASRPWLGRILGVGLDNNEERNLPAKIQAVFARARELGLHMTSHCDVN
jgi:hypothetical protein